MKSLGEENSFIPILIQADNFHFKLWSLQKDTGRKKTAGFIPTSLSILSHIAEQSFKPRLNLRKCLDILDNLFYAPSRTVEASCFLRG